MSAPAFRDSNAVFVILTWNSEVYIENCLRSVLGLRCARLDVWVIDNGSSDGTPRVLSSFSNTDDRLRIVLENENLGTTISRNRVLRALPPDVDYVCVLDSDTVVNQEALDDMVNVLRADRSIGVAGPVMADSSGKVQLSGRNLPTLGIKLGKVCPFKRVSRRAHEAEIPNAPVANGLQDVGYLLSACWLMPKSTIDTVGLLDEEIFYAPEDVEWCLRCHKAGLRVVLVKEAQIVHEYQRISRRKLFSRANYEHIKGLAHYFYKHRYLIRAPKISPRGSSK